MKQLAMMLVLMGWPVLVVAQPAVPDPLASPAISETTVPDISPKPDPSSPPATAQPTPEKQKSYSKVTLRALNKVTARSEPLELTIGEAAAFGTLMITPRSCWASGSDKLPEQAAFLEITETKAGEKPAMIFSGWMFASSPALSALEHPVYDLTMMACAE